MTPFIAQLLPGEERSGAQHSRRASEQFAYVVDGSVEIQTEYYEPAILRPGECIYIDANMEHAYRLAPRCVQATLLCVLLGPMHRTAVK